MLRVVSCLAGALFRTPFPTSASQHVPPWQFLSVESHIKRSDPFRERCGSNFILLHVDTLICFVLFFQQKLTLLQCIFDIFAKH